MFRKFVRFVQSQSTLTKVVIHVPFDVENNTAGGLVCCVRASSQPYP